MNKIFITGGCGFVGSHLVEYLFEKYKKSKIIVYDKITYAANPNYLNKIKKSKRLKIIIADILNYKKLLKHTKNTDLIIHAAAESHVDRSFILNKKFIKTNVMGTRNVMEASKINKIKKIIHISTDEVYGEIYKGSFNESSNLKPSNPYSSSKAAAEMIVNGYIRSYNLPVIIIRGNNIFGTRQHYEKLIPACCLNIIQGKKMFIHGSGLQKRSFIFVEDFCKGINTIINKGKLFNTYNIGSNFEYQNIEVINLILNKFGLKFNDNVKYVKDRPFNDYRYSININKIKKLKWRPKHKLEDKISLVIDWYKKNYKLFK